MAVFLPVALVSGVTGELFRPFAAAVAIALAASLLVSMTIVPVLAYWFLRRQRGPRVHAARAKEHAGQGDAEDAQVTRLQRGYLPVLRVGLRHPMITLALALVVFAGTLGSATLLRTDFLGSISDEATLQIKQELPPGTRLAATSDAAEKVEQVLAATPAVSGYLTTIGGGGSGRPGAVTPGANVAAITVTLTDGSDADAVQRELQEGLNAVSDAGEITVSAQDTGATNTDITVTVTGEKYEDLQLGAQRVEQLLGSVAGLTDVRSNVAEQRKVLQVKVDRTEAAAKGFTQAEIGQAVANALRGTQVGSITLAGETRDIFVHTQFSDAKPSSISDIELPVSQLQQQKAQEKAADKLADKQETASKKAQKKANAAVADQQAELREQRSKATDGLDDLEEQLRELQAARPLAPSPPNPTIPGIPVTTDLLAQQQYAQQLQQYAQQVAQLSAAVEQAEKGIDQIDDQLQALAEQAEETADQRKESQQLQDEQEALADVRAQPLRVRDVATVETVSAPTTVTQIDGEESVTVLATPTGGNLGALSETIQQRLDVAEDLPAGVTATLGGASQDQQDAFRQLGLAMLVAIALVFVIMVATFRSLVQPLILLVSIPFAATGAIAGLLLTDTPLGVPAMVGLLMLIGIVVTNAIVLIDLINQYRASGRDVQSAVLDGARLRLRPIIMTACATIFALIPMGLGLTGGGAFISQPLAVVVIGGLVSSTVLTLLLVPVLYTLVERRGERRARRNQARALEG